MRLECSGLGGRSSLSASCASLMLLSGCYFGVDLPDQQAEDGAAESPNSDDGDAGNDGDAGDAGDDGDDAITDGFSPVSRLTQSQWRNTIAAAFELSPEQISAVSLPADGTDGIFVTNAYDELGNFDEYIVAAELTGTLVAESLTQVYYAFPNGTGQDQDEEPDPSTNHALESRLDVLGSVGGHLEAVKNHGGKEARRRLETYLASIEQLENQTQGLLDSTPPEVEVDVSVDIPENWATPNPNSKYWQHSNNFAPLGKIMMDTTIASLALDRTRVATMHWSASGTDKGPADGQHYQTLGLGLEGNNTQDHHMSHDGNDQKRRNQARVFRWYYTQLEYFISRLKAIPDGEGSLFDSTLVVVCSEFGGYNHSYNDVPCLLVGSGGGVVESGQYIDVHNNGHKPYSNLMLTLAKGFGMDMNSFGHSNGQVDQVLL